MVVAWLGRLQQHPRPMRLPPDSALLQQTPECWQARINAEKKREIDQDGVGTIKEAR